ncbi:MAG: DUF1513 domain-containing protein [Pseudomonadota bacterium]
MATRRGFLAGLVASGLAPRATWADAGDPSYLAAAQEPSGAYRLYGLDAEGQALFDLDLPGRGHAAAAHPTQPLAVAFARRPGRFALVIDCVTGHQTARLDTPEGYHFCGHGAFSGDGALLFTTENDFAAARGMIGVWDAEHGFTRLGAFPSGGVGPHEMRIMPDGQTLVVANGGIETHPDTGRTKLNIPEMRPNLTYLRQDGSLIEQHEPPREWHKASIRHLSVRPDGLVGIACQWEGDLAEVPPLLATHRLGQALRFHAGQRELERRLQGYAGSIAFSGDGSALAITGPRGGLAAVFMASGKPPRELPHPDICGVARTHAGLLFTTGQGMVLSEPKTSKTQSYPRQWDNHLVHIG